MCEKSGFKNSSKYGIDEVKRTKKLLSDYRRLTREIPDEEEFTEDEKVEKRWAFLRDLMGTALTNSQESVVEKEEKRRAENMYFIDRIERAIETYREECETSKKPEAMRCYREVYEYYIAEEEKTVAQIASEECVSEKTVYKDIGNACKIIYFGSLLFTKTQPFEILKAFLYNLSMIFLTMIFFKLFFT